MGDKLIVTGMILSTIPIGDYDKRVVILTRERGKISAFAKGARRQNSSLLAATDPFCFGEFVLYEGRTSYNVTQASISNYFMELKSDLEGTYYAYYFMEFTDYYTKENNDEILMLKLLYQSLRALSKESLNKELIRCIFELKAMVIGGEYPEVFNCTICGKEIENGIFSSNSGGIVCKNCKTEVIDGIRLEDSTLYTLQYIETSKIEKLYTFTVSEPILHNLKKIMDHFKKVYIDKRFKTLEVLKECLYLK